jgi:hypothetical protein
MQLDLNLLTALDTLLEGRIRHTTWDQILVRTRHKMTPTPYAIAVPGTDARAAAPGSGSAGTEL